MLMAGLWIEMTWDSLLGAKIKFNLYIWGLHNMKNTGIQAIDAYMPFGI